MRIASIALALLAGCATQAPTTVTVDRAVVVPCPRQAPARPSFPADHLDPGADVWTIGTLLWADRKAREAYELELRAVAEECGKK